MCHFLFLYLTRSFIIIGNAIDTDTISSALVFYMLCMKLDLVVFNCCYLFIVIIYFSNYPIFYIQWALSPQSVFAIYIYFALWPGIENFLMQIIFHMTDRGKSVSEQRNFVFLTQINSLEYIREATAQFTHFAFSQGSCGSTHPFLCAESGFEQPVSTK